MKSWAGVALSMILVWSLAARPAASDWPQWRGPERTDLSEEKGLLSEWPESGPPLLWRVSNLGKGYGSVAIKDDRIFVQGAVGADSMIFCLKRADGSRLWSFRVGPALTQDRGDGPRSTPTVDQERLYALSEAGELACLKTKDGSLLWRRNILKDFSGQNPHWLISESPLVDGDRVIIAPGGARAGIVALDKLTGETVWTSRDLSDPAGYSSAIAADVRGVRTIVAFTSSAGVGVRASDGKLMWRYEPVANRTANVATPILYDDKVFYTSAYSTGCALLQLTAQDGEIKAKEIYFSREMQNHHGGVVLVDGYIYGFSNLILTCLEFATGKVLWQDRSVGKGSVTYADGHLYVLSERNVVGLVEATPQGYKEKGRFAIPDQGLPSWAHPVVCGGRLYIRNQSVLDCYTVKRAPRS